MKTVCKKISFGDSLTLESGQVLSGFELMTETYGELNSEKTNAVLVCHAFSGNHHAAGINDGEVKIKALPEYKSDELLEIIEMLNDQEANTTLVSSPLFNNIKKEIVSWIKEEFKKIYLILFNRGMKRSLSV